MGPAQGHKTSLFCSLLLWGTPTHPLKPYSAIMIHLKPFLIALTLLVRPLSQANHSICERLCSGLVPTECRNQICTSQNTAPRWLPAGTQ